MGYTRITEKRQLEVERLRVQGYTIREIAELLAKPVDEGGLRNPETGEPFSKSTIGNDVQEIAARWSEMLDASILENRGREVRELRLARQMAWRRGDLTEIRLSVAQEAKLLGTETPVQQVVTGQMFSMRTARELTDDELLAIAAGGELPPESPGDQVERGGEDDLTGGGSEGGLAA